LLLRQTLLDQALAKLGDGRFEAAVERVLARQSDPRSEVEALLKA
jgi:hypothetical protein